MKNIFLVGLFLILMVCCIDEKEDTNLNLENNYLLNNYLTIDTSDVDFDFSPIFTNTKIDNTSIFFTGESHGIDINQKLEFMFLKYFIKHYNFKYILAELPLSHAEILNKYINEQDDKTLDEYHKYLKGTYAGMVEKYEFWRNLRILNNALPDEKKLTIIGVDLEFQMGLAIKWIKDNYLKTDIPDEIEPDISLLLGIDTDHYNTPDLIETCKIIKNSMRQYPLVYQQYLGNNYTKMKLIIENIINAGLGDEIYRRNVTNWNRFRDSVITSNFFIQDKSIENGKYYGQWGNFHTFQLNTNSVNWFASNLQKSDKYKDKVLTCHYIYENSLFRNKDSGTASRINTQPRPGYYSFVNTNYPVIFNLINGDSPYQHSLIKICGELSNENAGVTSDYFQYFVLIKDAKPTEIYR